MSVISFSSEGFRRLFQERKLDIEVALVIHATLRSALEDVSRYGVIDLAHCGIEGVRFDLTQEEDRQFLIHFDAWMFCVTGGLCGFSDELRIGRLGAERPRQVIRGSASTR